MSDRLGHAKVQTTLEIYTHVTPTIQKSADGIVACLEQRVPVATRLVQFGYKCLAETSAFDTLKNAASPTG